jgi:3-phenylpropionate/trans-cinnamate dioxygenase ferredoxin reductase component
MAVPSGRRPRRMVVAGGSLAGLHAAEALRDEGFDGQVIVLNAETELPYDRPPLSKQVLSGEWPPDRARLRTTDQLAAAGIDLWAGALATGLDLDRREVRLADGQRLPYDGLVIATGATARSLPGTAPRPGLHSLRTLAECLALRAELAAGARLAIVGAGFIGMEVAAAARLLGAPVAVIDPLTVPMRAVLGDRLGTVLRRLHEQHGVTFLMGRGVRHIRGHARVEGLELDDGTVIAADAVLVGIGATPGTDWLADSGLGIGNGLICDACLGAGPPGIVAAGDVASWHNPLFDERMRIEHWTNATEQGAAAARNLLRPPAEQTAFSAVPYFWSDQYDCAIQFAGRPGTNRTVVLDDEESARFLALFSRDRLLTGVLAVNAAKPFIRGRRMIGRQLPVERAMTEMRALLASAC